MGPLRTERPDRTRHDRRWRPGHVPLARVPAIRRRPHRRHLRRRSPPSRTGAANRSDRPRNQAHGVGDFRRLLDQGDRRRRRRHSRSLARHPHASPPFEAGKDVFWKSRSATAWRKAARWQTLPLHHERVTQMGNHIHNTGGNYRRAVEIVQSGKLGKITRVHSGRPSPTQNFKQGAGHPTRGFDYDFWLGPRAPARLRPLRSHGLSASSGITPAGSSSTSGATSPTSLSGRSTSRRRSHISAVGGRFFLTDTTECPDTWKLIWSFRNLLYHLQLAAHCPARLRAHGQHRLPVRGDRSLAGHQLRNARSLGARQKDRRLPAPAADDSAIRRDICANSSTAIKSRNLETTCNFRYGHISRNTACSRTSPIAPATASSGTMRTSASPDPTPPATSRASPQTLEAGASIASANKSVSRFSKPPPPATPPHDSRPAAMRATPARTPPSPSAHSPPANCRTTRPSTSRPPRSTPAAPLRSPGTSAGSPAARRESPGSPPETRSTADSRPAPVSAAARENGCSPPAAAPN